MCLNVEAFLSLIIAFSGRSAAMGALYDLKSPSVVVGSPEAIQAAAKFLIYGRPVEAQGLQPALYNRTIAQLVYDLENLDTIYPHPSADHLAKCIKFMEISNKFYTGHNAEKMRLEDLRAHYGIFLEDHDDNIKVEQLVQGARVGILCVYGVFEGKNESGLGGDPLLQAMVSYAKANQDKKVSIRRVYRANVSPHSVIPKTCSKGHIFLRFSSVSLGMCSLSV